MGTDSGRSHSPLVMTMQVVSKVQATKTCFTIATRRNVCSSRPDRSDAYAASAKSAQVLPLASPMPVGWSHSSAGAERSLEPLLPLQHNDLARYARPNESDVTVRGTGREEWGGTHGTIVKVVSHWGKSSGEVTVSLGSGCACGMRQRDGAGASTSDREDRERPARLVRLFIAYYAWGWIEHTLLCPYVVRTAVAGTSITCGPLLVPQSNRGYVYHPFARL